MDSRNVIRWSSMWVGACMVAVAAIAIEAGTASGQGKYTKEDIVKAWKERQERVKSARFEWTDEQTHTRGSVSYDWKLFNPKLKDVIPTKDTTFSVPYEASFDGNKLRYAYTRKNWSKSKSGYEPQSYVSVFNGVNCVLMDGPKSNKKWHTAQIRKESYHIEYTNLNLQPILMTFRALTPRMRSYDIANFDLTSTKSRIGSSICLELSQRFPNGLENRLWLDPARGFILVRCAAINNGRVLHKLDVRYKLGTAKEWLPDQWSMVWNRPDGQLETSHQARVTHYALNSSIPSEEFEMQFPLGTKVFDEKNKLSWIVRPDGSGKRMVSPLERGLPYAKLVADEPGSAFSGGSGGSINWPMLGGISLALAGLVVVFLRFRRLKKRSTP